MADSPTPHQRRAPPSPLAFSPDAILSPVPLQAQLSGVSFSAASVPNSSSTVSMPFVRRHVTRRLKAAKAECDKELQRITNNITAFFEERLRETDYESERDRRERDYDVQYQDVEPLREPFAYQPSEFGSLHHDDDGSDSGYDMDQDTWPRHSRHHSAQMSPASLRRQPAPWDRPLSTSLSSNAVIPSPASSSIMLPDVPISRKQQTSSNSWAGSSSNSRRLSRNIHIPTHSAHSEQSSRSTSRSRSPLPPVSSHGGFSEYAVTSAFNRRSSRILVDDPVDPIMTALYDIIGVATDVQDMSIAQLTSQPKVCEILVQRIQNIGKTWDDHPDWHGRTWYVQVLLAVASLSRVVEWWEAEKQFWNFDEKDDEQDEPLMFVTKPADADADAALHDVDAGLEGFRLDDGPNDAVAPPSKPKDDATPGRDLRHLKADDHLGSAEATPSRVVKSLEAAESARVLATERLRLQAETAQNQNIVLELSLDGEHFIWVNHAWRVVVGTEPEDLPGTRISSLLSPSDWGVFKAATQRLQQDDSHTVEVRFKLQVIPTNEYDPTASLPYQQMEGKGMLMIDREDGQPSHTMWVVKPIAAPRFEYDTPSITLEENVATPEPASVAGAQDDTEQGGPFPFSQPISTEPILCRICECQIPQWYFEKHSETCAETHRLEAEIVECNESISELRSTIRDLTAAVERPTPSVTPEYRGMPIFTPSSSPSMSSPLQLFRANRLQRLGVKKLQRRLLDQIDDILQVALEVSIPSLKEEEANEPIERQRLLSPTAERKISQIRNWAKPTTEDAALSQLIQDAERLMRQKIDGVVRMQNTIRYSEKIWSEWQDRVAGMLETIDSGSDEDDGSIPEEEGEEEIADSEHAVDDQSSTRSEYGGGVAHPLPQPTPVQPTPVLPAPAAVAPVSVAPSHARPMAPPFMAAPTQTFSQRQQLTRSSTPSSVSSPLALAAPIVASTSPDEMMPPMLLDEGASVLTVKTRKSAQNLLEPKFIVTPPASPMPSGNESSSLSREPSMKRSHRRLSNATLLTSPPATGPLSPRQTAAAPLPRTTPTSIKDFEIIKPISKGAFGSVFLAKKKVTGDYYAIKVLKKADMIAKNQITNVKAERMILMKQAESPYVAKLYFTFQSKDNLYLVMEYLNGGDCAALLKSLGSLPEEWTKNYIAEVVLGLEYLHQRGIVHRDLKPDNLLIDQHGHVKMTDFGLSRIGLLGRQTREPIIGRILARRSSRSRPPSMDSAYLSSPLLPPDSAGGGSYFNHRPGASTSRMGVSPYPSADEYESGSEFPSLARRSGKWSDSPLPSFANELATDLRSHSNSGAGTPPGEQKVVGTPDYLAPETILGLRGDDAAVDWWALGVITYEFLYGIPPFHAETPEKVFENILSGQIEWHEEYVDFSPEARDFMERLMTLDPNERLGAGGADEVKAHPFFAGIDWDKVTTTEAAFIPQVTDPESTDYFDPRGALPQLFHDDDPVALQTKSATDSPVVPGIPFGTMPVPISGRDGSASGGSDDFGSFSFKNLPVLKQANDDVIRKLKTDQMAPMTHALTEPVEFHHRRKRSMSQRMKKPPSVVTSIEGRPLQGPPSPATSTSSIASSPSRTSLPPPTPGVAHSRKPSEFGAVERFKLNHMEGVERRNTMPSRLRTASISSTGENSGSETWASGSMPETGTPASSILSVDLRRHPDPSDRAVTCLLAEDNPITAKIIETLLIRLGCRVVVVADGSEAISVAMGDIKFDCILMDIQMPVLDGESAAKYIRSTNSKNTNTPIVAVSAYSGSDPSESSNAFSAFLPKPVQKADLIGLMRQLGFRTSMQASAAHTKAIAASASSHLPVS